MLTIEHQTAEGVIKINCKPLEQSELKKFDKNEKVLVVNLISVSKGELQICYLIISSFGKFIMGYHYDYQGFM